MENILFYGGIAAMAAAVLLLSILVPVFRARRRKLMRRIEDEAEF